MSKEYKKWAYILPNTFTALNLACGFGSIMLTMGGHTYLACLALGLGAIFDSVDGRIARMVGCQSPFGEQFDSMSDLISFGLAPAILVYSKYLAIYGRLGMALAFLFVLCAALRLARFNVNITRIYTDYFQGLPVPGAALGLVGFVLFSLELRDPVEMNFIIIPYIIIYSVLMISNVPFPAWKKNERVKSHQKYAFALIVGVLASLFVYGEMVVGIFITAYVLGVVGYFLTHRGRYQDVFNWEEDANGQRES